MNSSIQLPLDVVAIRHLLPHRYPFLLVDRVIEFDGDRIRCLKNVSANEPFFQGHFPSRPVMPGVLLIEALAQAGGILSHLARGTSHEEGGLSYLVKVDGARFSRMVGPGDQVMLDVSIKRNIRNMVLYQGTASVDGEDAACAEILCAEVKGA